jgi:hypothetical protein
MQYIRVNAGEQKWSFVARRLVGDTHFYQIHRVIHDAKMFKVRAIEPPLTIKTARERSCHSDQYIRTSDWNW